jgi:hypothetical protein
MVVITFFGGAGKASKCDWSCLLGRDVVMWPDADQAVYKSGPKTGELMPEHEQASMKAMIAVAKQLESLGTSSLIVRPPLGVRPKWDLADIEEAGFTASDARIHLSSEAVHYTKILPVSHLHSSKPITEGQRNEPSFKKVADTPIDIARKVRALLDDSADSPNELLEFKQMLADASFSATVLASAIRTINHYQYTKESVLVEALKKEGFVSPEQNSERQSSRASAAILSTQDIAIIIRNDLGFDIRRNLVTGCYEVNGEQMDDSMENAILEACREVAPFKGKELENERIIRRVLSLSPAYHPFKEYLTRCKERFVSEAIDSSPIDDLMNHVAFSNVADRNWFKLILRRWAAGHVTRVMRGWQNMALVIKGKQGIGKSTFAQAMAKSLDRRYFVEKPVNPQNKDDDIQMTETFIWEIGEVGGTTVSTDPNHLKNFISKPIVNIRRPYARHMVSLAPMASFIGSTNDQTFLVDDTGSRRWWCVEVESIDAKWFRDDFDADLFWGWAFVEAESCNWSPGMTDEEKIESEKRNEAFRLEDPIESTIESALEPCPSGFVSNEQIKQRLYSCGITDINSSMRRWKSVVNILAKMGGKKENARNSNGLSVRGFRGFKLRHPLE